MYLSQGVKLIVEDCMIMNLVRVSGEEQAIFVPLVLKYLSFCQLKINFSLIFLIKSLLCEQQSEWFKFAKLGRLTVLQSIVCDH